MKIEIQIDDGSQMIMKRGSHIYYRNAEGREGYWDWQHFSGRSHEFESLFTDAHNMLERFKHLLPDLSTAPGP